MKALLTTAIILITVLYCLWVAVPVMFPGAR